MADFTNFYRSATAAVGALIVSVAFVSAAVAPATVAGRTPAATYAAAEAPVEVPAKA
ncbi:hypothetical protein [Sphingosinicella terrae]|jgi:hypothetical protein|uniref:hypothetical protein n=1 Tax=Sphingosinicella terrae TaxID=2172047 RepID=UPI0013B3E154|nr:hypothetical protein [Sphingosinicella terrae]